METIYKGPAKLQPGDVVKSSIKGNYVNWTVIEVADAEPHYQDVTASWPGRGSVRFKWQGRHVRSGVGHGMRFYFVRGATTATRRG